MPKITFSKQGNEIWDIRDDLAYLLHNPAIVGDLDTCIRVATRDFHVYPKQSFDLVLHPDQKATFKRSSGYCPNPFSPDDDLSLGGIYETRHKTVSVNWDKELPVNVGVISTGGYHRKTKNEPELIWTGGLRLLLPDKNIHVQCPLWAHKLIDEATTKSTPNLTDTLRIEVANPNHFNVFEVR